MGDVFRTLQMGRPNQVQVQDQKRRQNQGPAIAEARAAATAALLLPPVGSSLRWWGATDPEDPRFMLEDGRLLQVGSFPELFAVIGNLFSLAGDPAGTMRLPDSRGRADVGAGQGSGTFNRPLGSRFGSETTTLDATHIPPLSGTTGGSGRHNHAGSTSTEGSHSHTTDAGGSHDHGYTGHTDLTSAAAGGFNQMMRVPVARTTDSAGSHTHGLSTNGAHSHGIPITEDHTHSVTVNDAGGGIGHANAQPSIACNHIVRVLP